MRLHWQRPQNLHLLLVKLEGLHPDGMFSAITNWCIRGTQKEITLTQNKPNALFSSSKNTVHCVHKKNVLIQKLYIVTSQSKNTINDTRIDVIAISTLLAY